MNNQFRNKRNLILILLVIGIILGFVLMMPSVSSSGGIQVQLQLPQTNLEGFTRATGPIEIRFPRDNGSHDDYLTEWWYYTGNLEDINGGHFGYQLTFFRRALTSAKLDTEIAEFSPWRSGQAYSVHFALTDVSREEFNFVEEFSRGAAGLAGSQATPYRVWLNQYQVEEQLDGTYLLEAATGDVKLNLTLKDNKGPILHGNQGYSQKGVEPGNASYYISQTSLESRGTVQIGEEAYVVEGISWMDHEYSTSALSSSQVGWDWFSIQLNDESELMVFQLRKEDGSIDPFSSGTIIEADGTTRNLAKDEFHIQVLDTWESPNSSAIYPSHWQIEIPSEDLQLEIRPHLADQELRLSITYWEGAVVVEGLKKGEPISGNGYAELTGYKEAISERF